MTERENDWIDIGHDHAFRFVAYKGDPRIAIDTRHKGRDGNPCEAFIPFDGGEWAKGFFDPDSVWQVQSFEPLTVSPSLLCRGCGDHGFITNGRWVPV